VTADEPTAEQHIDYITGKVYELLEWVDDTYADIGLYSRIDRLEDALRRMHGVLGEFLEADAAAVRNRSNPGADSKVHDEPSP
jgi:hypothetical protein